MLSERALSFRTKLTYGFGDLGNAAAATVIPLLFLFYLTDVAGISPGRAGTLLLICKIWDAIIDPYIGIRSDRLKSRLGRRRPFFIAAALPFGILFGLLWTIPDAMADKPALYIILAYLAFTTVFSLIQIPYNSLTAQLTQDYHQRTLLTTYRMAFSIGAGILFSVVPIEIVHAFSDQAKGFSVMGWVVAGIIVLSPLALFIFIREDAPVTLPEQQGFFAGLRIVARNKPFWSALVMFLFSWMALDVLAAMLIYYIKYWLNLEARTDVFLGLVFVTAAIFLPLWLKMSNRFGKKPAFIAGAGLMVLTLLALFLIPADAHMLAYFLCFFAGVGVSAIHILPWAIIPDVIEFDELKSGQRREGLYSGFASLLRQLSTSIALFLVGILLEAAGYVPDAVQTETAARMIRIIIGPVAASMYLISILAILVYPIDFEFHSRMTHILAKKRKRHDATHSQGQLEA